MEIKASSSLVSLLFAGIPWHIFFPWAISVDTGQQIIKVSKRNWFLIGVDTQIIQFNYIRTITINQHLIGADIIIKVIGGTAEAKYISKGDCRKIKDLLISFNQRKKNGKNIVIN